MGVYLREKEHKWGGPYNCPGFLLKTPVAARGNPRQKKGAWTEMMETGDLRRWHCWRWHCWPERRKQSRGSNPGICMESPCLWLNAKLDMQKGTLQEAIKTVQGRPTTGEVVVHWRVSRAHAGLRDTRNNQSQWTEFLEHKGAFWYRAQKGHNLKAGLNSP